MRQLFEQFLVQRCLYEVTNSFQQFLQIKVTSGCLLFFDNIVIDSFSFSSLVFILECEHFVEQYFQLQYFEP